MYLPPLTTKGTQAPVHGRLIAIAIVAVLVLSFVKPDRLTNVQTDGFAMSFDTGTGERFLACQGSGHPAVILEAGYGMTSANWQLVQPLISEANQVCAWDRPGLGQSEAPEDPPLNGEMLAIELHNLLDAADVTGPYVMVGFSIGGLLVRTFADLYADEVAGLVLIDPTPPAWPATKVQLASPRAQESLRQRHSGLDPREPERIDILATGLFIQAHLPAKMVPAFVVTASNTAPRIAGYGADEQAVLLAQLQQEQIDTLQAKHCVAPGTTHNIPEQEPQLVAQAVASIVQMVRNPAATMPGTDCTSWLTA